MWKYETYPCVIYSSSAKILLILGSPSAQSGLPGQCPRAKIRPPPWPVPMSMEWPSLLTHRVDGAAVRLPPPETRRCWRTLKLIQLPLLRPRAAEIRRTVGVARPQIIHGQKRLKACAKLSIGLCARGLLLLNPLLAAAVAASSLRHRPRPIGSARQPQRSRCVCSPSLHFKPLILLPAC